MTTLIFSNVTPSILLLKINGYWTKACIFPQHSHIIAHMIVPSGFKKGGIMTRSSCSDGRVIDLLLLLLLVVFFTFNILFMRSRMAL